MRLLLRQSARTRVPTRDRSRSRSRLLRVTMVLAALGIAASVWALRPDPPTGLKSAQPDLSAHVGRAPDQVRLDFAQAPAGGSLAEVVVLSPKDENLARGAALRTPDGVSQPVAPLRERGAYQVAYEVQLVDGDVARGQYWFWYAPTSSGSISRLQSPALLGLLIVAASALAAGLLAPGRARRSVVLVPAQRTGSPTPTRTNPVPVQRSRDSHGGLSPPGSTARPPSTPSRPPAEPTKPIPPRQV